MSVLADASSGNVRTSAGDEGPSALSEDSSGLATIVPLLRCPIDGAALAWDATAQQLTDPDGHRYALDRGIPCLFVPNDWDATKGDVTDIVKAFYEETPLPSYDGLETRDSLRRKVEWRIFGRLLDEQVSHDATILEVGCGTGQMTNFLGMGWGRTVIGAISA